MNRYSIDRNATKTKPNFAPTASGLLQGSALNHSPTHEVPPIVHEALRSPGQPLDAATRALMETRFGYSFSPISAHAIRSVPMSARLSISAPHDDFEEEAELIAQQIMTRSPKSAGRGYDFSGVRIHADEQAAKSAQAVHALAYTIGQNIVFGSGQYNPNTFQGAKLLAHELTHVIQQSGAPEIASVPRVNGLDRNPHIPQQTGLIARQPAPMGQGWSDAPDKNRMVTMVDKDGNIINVFDDQGKLISGKIISEGVWRIPLEVREELGFTGDDKVRDEEQITSESAKGKALALIPDQVRQLAWDQSKKLAATEKADKVDKVLVDVLFHFHGHGVGYRQLEKGKDNPTGTLKVNQLRDVALYQIEKQLQSHVKAKQKLLIAVMPQGSLRSNFGNLPSQSDAYLAEVFNKLKAKNFLPQNAALGRLILSAHSGAGPTAMRIANQHMGTEVILFDAINWDKKTCTSNEITTVRNWVTRSIAADIASLTGQAEPDQVATLQSTGTRFRGITSDDLSNTDQCSYGYYYNELNKHIKHTIKAQGVTPAVRAQLERNYTVEVAQGTSGHEKVMGAQNLENALRD